MEPIADRQLDFNHQLFKEARSNVLNNQKVPQCAKCYKAEEQDTISLRQRTIDDIVYADQIENLTENIAKHRKKERIEPLWYDLRISNNCNLSCKMCGPKYSSTWAKELGIDNSHLGYDADIEISPNTYKIQLAGGEPFMIKKFASMLRSIENKDCEIVVNTNGTIITKPLFEELKKFKNTLIILSLDGVGDINDQIRKGSKWNEIKGNIQIFRDAGFKLFCNTVVQKDNVNHLLPLSDFLEENEIYGWLLSRLFEPEELQWENQKNIDFRQIKILLEKHIVQKNEQSRSLLESILKSKTS